MDSREEMCKHIFVSKHGGRKDALRCKFCNIPHRAVYDTFKHCVGHGWKDHSYDVKLMCEEFLEWLSHNHGKKVDRMKGSPIEEFAKTRHKVRAERKAKSADKVSKKLKEFNEIKRQS